MPNNCHNCGSENLCEYYLDGGVHYRKCEDCQSKQLSKKDRLEYLIEAVENHLKYPLMPDTQLREALEEYKKCN